MVGPLWQMFTKHYLKSLINAAVWAAMILMVRRKLDFVMWVMLTAVLSQIHLLLEKWAPKILTSYASALSWHTGASITRFEGFKGLKRCSTCPKKQPGSQSSSKPNQYRFSAMLPVLQVAEKIGIVSSTENSDALPTPQNTKIPKPSKVAVKSVNADKCNALKHAGFRPTWTWEDVQQMPREEVEKIHQTASKMAGSTIQMKDVISCYPNYLGECSKPSSSKKTKPSSPKPTSKKPKVCDWNEFQKQLKQSVIAHYKKVYVVMSKSDKDMFDKRKGDLISFTTQKATLEIQSLIHQFQNKPDGIWKKHLTQLKMRSADGYLIQGTSYLVPWSLFAKFSGCFGKQIGKEGFGNKVQKHKGWFW